MKEFMKKRGVPFVLIQLLFISLFLAGCGGGGGGTSSTGGSGTSSSAAAFSSGTVTGFGSIIVDGVTLDDSIAQVNQEIDPNAPMAGTTTSVKLGMKVESMLDERGRITKLMIQPEVLGTISAMAGNGFTVAGQSVKVSNDAAAPTVFEGANSLADLVVGDTVEVHGSRDASDNIVATRIERKDPGSALGVRVVGTIANLDPVAKTFTISALTVNYGSATLLPTGSALAAGQRVAVWSDVALVGTTLTAKVVRIKTPQIADGSSVKIGGRVSGIVLTPLTFHLGDLSVDASTAIFINGVAGDLANGSLVRVSGMWQSGKVVANEVSFVKERVDATVRLMGAVTDFVSSASFKVRGVTVDASASIYSNGTAANLADGVLVMIEGSISGGVVTASSVDFVTAPVDGKEKENRIFPGTVSSYDEASGNFTLQNINLQMRIDAGTTLLNADGSAAAKADFAIGKRVLVRGNFVEGILVAGVIRILPMVGGLPAQIEGVLYALDPLESSFNLNGVKIFYEGAVFDNGSVSDLVNGLRVHVTASLVSGKIVASRIEIMSRSAATVEALGTMNDFSSNGSFMVAGQMVDASGSGIKFVNGSAAEMGKGRLVIVSGTMVNGKLIANRFEFKN